MRDLYSLIHRSIELSVKSGRKTVLISDSLQLVEKIENCCCETMKSDLFVAHHSSSTKTRPFAESLILHLRVADLKESCYLLEGEKPTITFFQISSGDVWD